jgi:23S rRNA (cytidine1920-2'-O)/16S rRNA (cytidine1409-2'-O)-methyltransferase
MAGQVRVGEGDRARTDRKAGDLVDVSLPVAVVEREPFVSRGGQKLASALDAFGVEPSGLVCLDVGASTGGFTDVLLQRGASKVYGVDVGRGQLADALRRDPRVVSMERTNARNLGAGVLPETVSLAVIDVSFISLELILGPVAGCFGDTGGSIVALVKPQFEAGKGATDHGVIRDPAVHRDVLDHVARHATGVGLKVLDLAASPLRGPEGNREFYLHLGVGTSGETGARAASGATAADLRDRIAEVTGG